MKALYILFPDYNYIDKCIESGIDTLIIPNQTISEQENNTYNPEYGSYSETISLLKYYKDVKVKKLLCILPYPYWKDFNPQLAFFDGKRHRLRTPCPTSTFPISTRLALAQNLCQKYDTELILDMENYGSYLTTESLDINGSHFGPDITCKCKACESVAKKNKTIEWWMFNNMCRNYKPIGQLANYNAWTYGKFKETPYIFVEKTYPMGGTGWFDLFKIKLNLKKWILINRYWLKRKAKYIAGAWLERFPENDFINYIEKMYKSFDGYWIYSQCRLSPESPYHYKNLDKQPKPFYNYLVTDEFFLKLKRLNEKLK